jgi:hypothetical protein
VLWHNSSYFGPALIQGDRILRSGDAHGGSGAACDLKTGAPLLRPDPLTGQMVEWRWVRTYGCNTPAASEHLLLFRSGAAGYFDLYRDGGTGNLGGFRSSCTLNMIVGCGVLAVPDLTRSCTCSYQNQSSVGLVPMGEAEMWTFTTARKVEGPVRRIGVLLGGPGSRKADNGTLWLEHPRAGGPSPQVGVLSKPERPDCFRAHAGAEGTGWITAAGARGLQSLTIPLGTSPAQRVYTVHLHFQEPDGLAAGERVFDVAVQGVTVLRRLDVSKEAGGPGRALVREIKGVRVRRDLTITLKPASDSAAPPVLCGVEVLAEGW